MISIYKKITGVLLAAALAACGGGGGNASTPTTGGGTTGAPTVATLLLTATSAPSISADGTSSVTINVQALDANNALVPNANVLLSATGNTILSSAVVVTSSTANVPVQVFLRANPADQSSRQAVVTASCTSCSAASTTLPVAVNGATLTVTNSGSSALTAGGNSVVLTALVKSATGNPIQGATVTFATTDPSVVSLSNTTGTTTSQGVATVTVSGLQTGSASVNVNTLSITQPVTFTVTGSVGSLSIVSPADGAGIDTNTPTTIVVAAPNASNITYFSSVGNIDGSSVFSNQTTSGSGANFGGSATLNVKQGGVVTIQVTDNATPSRSASIKINVSPPWQSANKVILSATQTTVGIATGNSTPSIRLTAQALYDPGTGAPQGVAKVPILFSMTGGPNAGEYLTPPYQLTNSSGYAYADFYAGTSASSTPIAVKANIQGTALSATSNLTIGGQALSVAFGPASVLRSSTDNTLYIQDYSVQVSDTGGNPVPGAVVTLKVRPVAYSLGSGCSIINVAANTPATYCSEDINGNGSLDSGEDGVRYLTTVATAGYCSNPVSNLTAVGTGVADGLLTPQNSVAGSVPATVTTGSLTSTSPGAGSFSLTYLKASAIWVIDKLTATVSVNGTESSTSTIFQLPASTADVKLPDTCFLPPSPFAN